MPRAVKSKPLVRPSKKPGPNLRKRRTAPAIFANGSSVRSNWHGRASQQRPVATNWKTMPMQPMIVPPWYVKKFNAETRELQKTARTLIDWTTETFNELCPDLDDFTYTLSWFDTAEAAVAGPSRSERAKLE